MRRSNRISDIWPIGTALFIVLLLVAPTSAEIKLDPSPLFAPLALAGEDDFDFDYIKDKKKKTESEKKTDPAEPSDTTGVTLEQFEAARADQPERRISKTKAVLLSLLVPGAGQFYTGARGRGEVFLGAEVATWIGYFAFRTYGNWKEDDYRRYAVKYAGIDPVDKNDEFYRNLTFYDSREDYNTAGRIIDPRGPYYPPGADYYWFWNSPDQREYYRTLRNDSETAFRKATFMLGVSVFNRILSAIDAFRLARKESSRRESEDFFSRNKLDVDFKANPFGSDPTINLAVSHRF